MDEQQPKGRLVISLDTELYWGSFDTTPVETHETAYLNTRTVVKRLCELFDIYDAPVTWALVMHLLDDCVRHDDMKAPETGEKNWFEMAPCNGHVDRNLWYAPELLDHIRESDVDHEIGLHGYSHMVLGSTKCSREAARDEVRKAVEVANRHGIDPTTYIFPRNKIGHRDVLRNFNIQYYRGVDARWYERTLPEMIKKPWRFSDELFSRTPPTVQPKTIEGLVELPGSQLIRPYRGAWKYTPHDSQVERAKKGIDAAARTGTIFHLWFHPFNLGVDYARHLELIEEILSYAADVRADDKLRICTLATAAREYVEADQKPAGPTE